MVDLRSLIRLELAERSWSQRDLAIQSLVSPSTISRYLSEEQDDLTVGQLIAIAGAFGKMAGDWLGHSARDPRLALFEPIADEINGTPAADRSEMIEILREHVTLMKKWRRRDTSAEVGREIRQSGTPPTKPGDETIEPSSSR